MQTSNSTNTISKHETFNETIDSIPENLKVFGSKGYSVINISTGDANPDSIEDKLLVFRKETEESTSNYSENKPDKRPLLMLLGQANSSYKLAFRHDNAVSCIECGGVFGDPFIATSIKNGYFSIEHGIAGGELWEEVSTFKFDATKENWFLYKTHYKSYKLYDSNDENAEALVINSEKTETDKDFGIIPIDKFNIYNKNGL